MLLKRAVLDKIVGGEIDRVFRRWKKPTVRAGGRLRCAVGVLAIETVEPIALSAIKVEDARRAGYASKAALLRELARRTTGDLVRITVRLEGVDPRIALREETDIGDLPGRVARIDARSRRGPWTQQVLRLIDQNPRVRAQELADQLGLDKLTFKRDVRKLKALGLTISHSSGYELSTRGRAYLETL